jgi:hypothetical protein
LQRETRNNSVAGILVLAGSALTGFAATRAWVTGPVATDRARWAGLTPSGVFGIDLLQAPGGGHGDVEQFMAGAAVVLALSAVLLLVTRIPVLGVLWRILALLAVAGLAVLCGTAWGVVNDPTSALRDGAFPVERVGAGTSADGSVGALQIEPGQGLWLLTLGCCAAGIGALVPAMRGSRVVAVPSGVAPVPRQFLPSGGPPSAPTRAIRSMPRGWYPDQFDPSRVRWFDGVEWTQFTQPRA